MFTIFLYFCQFLPDLDENYTKIYLKIRAIRLSTQFGPNRPKTTVWTSPVLNKLEGPGPFKDQDRFCGPKRSLGLDLKALMPSQLIYILKPR